MVETEFIDGRTEAGPDSGGHPGIGVSAHRSSPDRVVLVEAGNADGWIAFDADVAAQVGR